ncbi:hypothetical protein M0Q97_11630 [Candidatus Dojkabacteria bacterium]|jgi:hypothetical protein|nr:hypothetical protein [Candidatus Dojkabacteria bacterium]
MKHLKIFEGVKKEVTISEDDFYEQYNLVLNHFYDNPEDCAYGGCLFETYGKEYEYIISLVENTETANTVWSIVEDDDLEDTDMNDNIYISGFYNHQMVIGYLVTEEKVPNNVKIIVGDDLELRHKINKYNI